MMSDSYSLADKIIRKTDELKSKRVNFEKLWQDHQQSDYGRFKSSI